MKQNLTSFPSIGWNTIDPSPRTRWIGISDCLMNPTSTRLFGPPSNKLALSTSENKIFINYLLFNIKWRLQIQFLQYQSKNQWTHRSNPIFEANHISFPHVANKYVAHFKLYKFRDKEVREKSHKFEKILTLFNFFNCWLGNCQLSKSI